MKQILKRLELIKTAIDIDDEEIIELQILKLKKLEVDDAVLTIINKLENLDYGSVVLDIETYLSRYSGVVAYEDKEVQGLKLELKSLEKKLQTLSEQKREYLNDIDEFNTLYHLKLGALIQEILKLKKEILEKEIQSKKQKFKEEKSLFTDTQDTFDEIQKKIVEIEELLEDMDEDDESYEEINQVYEDLKENLKDLKEDLENQKEILDELEDDLEDEEFEKIKDDYEEFSGEYEHIKEESEDRYEISEDEKQELKKLYRKASRLCHPDIVVDELKKQAHKIMQTLNAAYSNKDLKTVHKILDNLENGIAFDVASDKIDDKKILKAKINELREKIDSINEEIADIKEDEIYKTISELDDWDEYFEGIKNTLEEEMQALKGQLEVAFEDDLESEEENSLHVETQNAYNEIQKKIDELEKLLEDMDEDDENYEEISQVYEELKENLQELEDELKNQKVPKEKLGDKKTKAKNLKPKKENSNYSKSILAIEQPTFEKIRRYCSNLKDDDVLSTYLAENGKMHKALIYSALDEFLEDLEDESLTIIDWGCGQGLASALVLDYVREKQLDIKISQVILVDKDKKSLSRAMLHVETLGEGNFKIEALHAKNNKLQGGLDIDKSTITLNLFANDYMPVDFEDIDSDILEEAYFVCLSNADKNFVDEVYNGMTLISDCQDVSTKNVKIGRFKKFERIFKIHFNYQERTIGIDEDEIRF